MSVPDLLQVFVYGTLKPGQVNFQKFCSGKVIESRIAIAPGQLFSLSAGYPAMTSGTGWVHGFVLAFANHQILRELDEYEDYSPQRSPHQNLYERQLIPTFGPTRQGSAWAYLMSPDRVHRIGGTRLPEGRWDNPCGNLVSDERFPAERLSNDCKLIDTQD